MLKNDKQEYDDIPVLYCSRCLSLKIMEDDVMGDYCPECGSTDIQEANIEDWIKLYEKQYKHKPFNDK